jgi:hypothetical protein
VGRARGKRTHREARISPDTQPSDPPDLPSVEITEETPTSYRLQLYYKPLGQRHSPVVSRAEATADTMGIAGAVLDELKKDGKDPAKDRIDLSVWAQQDRGNDGEASHSAFW